MESAEHLYLAFALMRQGIQVLLWEDKSDLVRALLVLKAGISDFPEDPVVLPTNQSDLQRFGLDLYERTHRDTPAPRRFLLIRQASAETVGTWLNGWRERLSTPLGTVLVIRRADYSSLCRRAPDLMSFAQSNVHDATGLLPLMDRKFVDRLQDSLSKMWCEQLKMLPGEMPTDGDIAEWNEQLKQNAAE